jgi:hypothetical protein
MLPCLLCHNNDLNSGCPTVCRSNEVFEDFEDSMGNDDEDQVVDDDGDDNAEWTNKKILQVVIGLFQHIMMSGSEIINIAADAFNSYSHTYYNKEPYHILALQGISWVTELLTGHSECIQCELGIHCHIFIILVNILCESRISDSRNIMLEEQLAIFLYACITSLSVCHLGEHFQCSNDTISRQVSQQLSS